MDQNFLKKFSKVRLLHIQHTWMFPSRDRWKMTRSRGLFISKNKFEKRGKTVTLELHILNIS